MKMAIYADRTPKGWLWRGSLCLAADRLFYGRRKFEQLYTVTHEIPIGKAFRLASRLNGGKVSASFAKDGADRNLIMAKQAVRSGIDKQTAHSLRIRKLEAAEGWKRPGGFLYGNEGLEEAVRRYAEVTFQCLAGRSLLPEEVTAILEHNGVPDADKLWRGLVQWGLLQGRLQILPGLHQAAAPAASFRVRSGARLRCRRCGSGQERMRVTHCASCGGPCAYCEACIEMGRVKECTPLIVGCGDQENRQVEHKLDSGRQDTAAGRPQTWSLSGPQQEAVRSALAFWQNHWREAAAKTSGFPAPVMFEGYPVRKASAEFFIWAVTGAGKTEMMFPLIEAAAQRGHRVLIASPRRDVILELAPRLAAAFPEQRIGMLYGGGEPWAEGNIMLTTTHQLIRFAHAFELCMIDEMDAFPFHGNPVLAFAAAKAVKPGGIIFWMSATPPKASIHRMKTGKLAHVRVPVRYHGFPLPVPGQLYMPPLWRQAESARARRGARFGMLNGRRKREQRLVRLLRETLRRGAQAFLFLPTRMELDACLSWVRETLHEELAYGETAAVSSQDPGRDDKVKAFREGLIRILLTTTILERGVTVAKTDVYVLGADAAWFNAAALVQMAGRAGRSASDPHGSVWFAAEANTAAQIEAVRQIREMNVLAGAKGYLREKGGGNSGV